MKKLCCARLMNQLFAYMQNLAAGDKRHREVDGILLYAGTSGGFSFDWRFFGRKLRVAAVDLSAEWPQVDAQMTSLLTV
jgi:hypothetical protein